MRTKYLIIIIFFLTTLIGCTVVIDGTSEESYKASLEKMKENLTQAESDSLVKSIMYIVFNSKGNKLDVSKLIKEFDGLSAQDLFKMYNDLYEAQQKILLEEFRIKDSLRQIEITDSIQRYNEQGLWTIEHFVDEFQVRTDKGYVTISCEGNFSNSAATNAKLKADVVVTDEKEVQIFLNEYGSQRVKSNSREVRKYIIKVLQDEEKYVCDGKFYSDRIYFEDSRLLSSLYKGGLIKIYIKELSEYGNASTYLFEMDATNFDKAFETLINN